MTIGTIALNGDIAKSLEPTMEERNAPLPPQKEYHIEARNHVFIGATEYDGHKALLDNYVKPIIGDMKLDEINPRMMDRYYKQLQTVKAVPAFGHTTDAFISARTIREVHKILRNAFNQAVKWELMAKNPVQNATLPKCETNTRDIWDAETLMKALSVCEDDLLSLAINLSFACSLRIGELLGLTWKCVDISQESIESDRAYIYVDKELQRVSRDALAQINDNGVIFKFPTLRGCNSTVLVLKEPKTKTSVRKVFLPKAVAEMLVERKAYIDELKSLLGDEYRDYDLVFATTCGTPTEPNQINSAFSKLIRENDLPKVVFHSLRHTSTTYKLKLSGGDIKAVQGDTGHAQATMVTERYAHILDDDRRVNAVRFQREFYGGGEPQSAENPHAPGSVAEQPSTQQLDPLQNLDATAKQQLLFKLLADSPDMSALLASLAIKGA
jgi:integrase